MLISSKAIASGYHYCSQQALDVSSKASEVIQTITNTLGTSLSHLLPKPQEKTENNTNKISKAVKEKTYSGSRNLLTRLVLGYLYASGQLLAPWMQKMESLSSQANQIDDNFSVSTTSVSNNVPGYELYDSASNTLAVFQQNLLNFAMVAAGSSLASKNTKTSLLAGLFSLIPTADATTEVHKTDAEGKKNLAKRTAPLSIVYPLPDISVQPGFSLSEVIDLQVNYALSNPKKNLELSIQQPNGTAVPNWLSLSMGDPSIYKSYYINAQALYVCQSGNYACFACDVGFKIVDISNPMNPVALGTYPVAAPTYPGTPASYIYVNGNSAIYGPVYPNQFYIFNIANPSNIVLRSTFTFPNSCSGMIASGNYVYAYTYTTLDQAYFVTVDISNPASPSLTSSLSLGAWGKSIVYFSVFGNNVFLCAYNVGLSRLHTQIFNVANPTAPSITYTFLNLNANSVITQGHYLFAGGNTNQGSGILVYDITQITNPILMQTTVLGTFNVNNMIIIGKYLYAFCTPTTGLIAVINIENPVNPILVSTFNTLDKLSNGFMYGNKVYTADGQAGLTIINAGKRALNALPSFANRGLTLVKANATDDVGNSVTDTFSIHVGDINVAPISNQNVYVGNTLMFTFSAGTFDYPGAQFNYTAQLVGGLPLPSFMSFDAPSRTFIFAPMSGHQNTYRIQVSADDGWGGTASTTFDLTVPDRPPAIVQPLTNQTAYSGEPFMYTFAAFSDSDSDPLTYSAQLQGSSSLPTWLRFNTAQRTFSGTPFGKGIFPIVVTARDNFGGSVTNTFTITVPPSQPIVLNTINTQSASVQIPYSFTLNSNTFYDIDNEPISYSAGNLPSFLTFNNATRTFTGTPQLQDMGTHTITLQANTTDGTASTSFDINVVPISSVPPVLQKQIPDVTEKADTAFSYTFDADTFIDPQNSLLTYQAELEGHLPLPPGLYFDSATRTLSGVLQNPQTLQILIRAANPMGAYAYDTFTLNILADAAPIVLNPLTNSVATVNRQFYYHIPKNTFIATLNDPLKITVLESNGKPLPHWLKWDSLTNTLSGKPGPWDTGTFQSEAVNVDVWASDSVGKAKTSFKIIIEGESFWDTFIKTTISLSSILATGYGIWHKRVLLWNFMNREKYRDKEPQYALVGHDFKYDVPVNFQEIKHATVFHEGKALTHLPPGITLEGSSIVGQPTQKSIGRFTIRCYDIAGYCINEFELIIKQNDYDDDPPEYTEYSSTAMAALYKVSHRQKQHDEESGHNSQNKRSGSIMMRPLRNFRKQEEK